MKVLVVEDNMALARNLVKYLSLKEIHADMSLDGKDGLHKASINHYDAIILDINLPEKNGMEVCQELREKGKTTPILMLTSKSTNEDIVDGLNIGADDYMAKPFDYDVLLARLNSLTRRDLKNKSSSIKIEEFGIEIDVEKIEVKQNSTKVSLSSLEFDLLKYLSQNKGKVVSRQEIYEKVWGEFDSFMFSKTVEVYIGYLRKKLGKDLIKTKKGFGYIIE